MKSKEYTLKHEHKQFLDSLFKTAHQLLEAKLDLDHKDHDTALLVFHRLFLTKYLRTFLAVRILVSKEYGEDAFILQRTLWEIWVKVVYTDLYPEVGSELLIIQYFRAAIRGIGQYRLVTGGQVAEGLDWIGQEVNYYEALKYHYERLEELDKPFAKTVRDTPDAFWPGKSLSDMYDGIPSSQKWVKVVTYDISSELVHSDAGVLTHYLDFTKSDTPPRIEPDGNFTYQASYSAAAGIIDLIRIVNNRSGVLSKESIELLSTDFKKVFIPT